MSRGRQPFRLYLKICLLLAGLYVAWEEGRDRLPEDASAAPSTSAPSDVFGGDEVYQAFRQRQSNRQVRGQGEIVRLLPDDNEGSRHQKFLVRVTGGITVLIAHNIDLAPRVEAVRPGDQIAFYGEYEWSEKGGVVHWTHRDPRGRHPHGWLQHRGRRYE